MFLTPDGEAGARVIDHITRLRALADAHARSLENMRRFTKPDVPLLEARLAAEAQALLAGAAALEREAAHCVWRLEVDQWGDSSLWHTACGRVWTFTDDGPVENRMDYCHGCGTRVLVAPPETGDDDAR